MGKILCINAAMLSALLSSSACTIGRTSGDSDVSTTATGTAANGDSTAATVPAEIDVLSSPTVAAADGNAPTSITLQVSNSAGLPLANQSVTLAIVLLQARACLWAATPMAL